MHHLRDSSLVIREREDGITAFILRDILYAGAEHHAVHDFLPRSGDAVAVVLIHLPVAVEIGGGGLRVVVQALQRPVAFRGDLIDILAEIEVVQNALIEGVSGGSRKDAQAVVSGGGVELPAEAEDVARMRVPPFGIKLYMRDIVPCGETLDGADDAEIVGEPKVVGVVAGESGGLERAFVDIRLVGDIELAVEALLDAAVSAEDSVVKQIAVFFLGLELCQRPCVCKSSCSDLKSNSSFDQVQRICVWSTWLRT